VIRRSDVTWYLHRVSPNVARKLISRKWWQKRRTTRYSFRIELVAFLIGERYAAGAFVLNKLIAVYAEESKYKGSATARQEADRKQLRGLAAKRPSGGKLI